MNNELTITLTGKEALAYIKKVHTELIPKVDETTEKAHATIKELTRENSNLKVELINHKANIHNLTEENNRLKEALYKCRTAQEPNLSLQEDTDDSEKDTTISEVIVPNPVSFPASKPNRSGTNWSTDELTTIEQALEKHYTLPSLKLKLLGRSEAAIRSMLNKYGIRIKKNKLYKRD